jgi:glycosyltransferase involved in cell wall biosynthesis
MRVLAYMRLAETLLDKGQPAEALEQLRHIFTFVRGEIPRNIFFARVLDALGCCYSELGKPEKVTRCRREAERCREASDSARGKPAKQKGKSSRRPKSGKRLPDLSVIIPTYNRRDTLGSCLAALSGQSLSPDRFEVVVVDDGSTDGTRELCSDLELPFQLQYHRQANAGTGAARRVGVEHSRARYVVLFNDDTIADPKLLAEHLQVHREHPHEKWAVLGDFRYPSAAAQRALTYFLNTNPFIFPQVSMEAGKLYGYAHFVTCNLSLRRDAVLEAGSFDPEFRVAEDTELGVRLERSGYAVRFHPAARAWHDHLDFTMSDMIRRAGQYGPVNLKLFRKHPHLVAAGDGPFGKADEEAAGRIQDYLIVNRKDVEAAVEVLRRFDEVDFSTFFVPGQDSRHHAEHVMDLFAKAVPQTYWFCVFESFLKAWQEEQEIAAAIPGGMATSASQEARL